MYDGYTELNNSIKNIYLTTQGTEQYRKPALRESTEKGKKYGKFYRFRETHGHNTNECKHLCDMIEELIRKKKLQQFMKASQDGGQGNSKLQGSTYQRGQVGPSGEEPRRLKKCLVINIIIGGPQPADKSQNEIDRYVDALKHAKNESCFATEVGAPAKQFKTMKDDIVF